MTIDRVTRTPEIRDLVALALVEAFDAVPAPEGTEALGEEIAAGVERLVAHHAGKTAGGIDLLQPARVLYRSVGMDPTRYRPSPEALLRRLLKGEPFPRIHPAVDLANLWAVLSGLPVGLYDADKLEPGPIEARLGRAGESYEGINKPEVHLDGRLALADARGPFGNPSSDSLRTSVGPGSSHLLFVMFAPAGHDIGALDLWAAWLRERAEALFGARTVSGVLP
jgi:DNA/RNA-binding domain of Phe-tRNA-synthetase-like protein